MPGSPEPKPSFAAEWSADVSSSAEQPAEPAPRPAQVACVQRVISFYETLSPRSLEAMDQVYAAQARFKDPFNEVVGLRAIRSIFVAMFRDVDNPRFVVTGATGDARQACVLWEFHFSSPRIAKGTPQCIRGASWLEFDETGKVTLHRDYWDAAEELYEKLPLIGALMRWLRARLGHATPGAGVTTD